MLLKRLVKLTLLTSIAAVGYGAIDSAIAQPFFYYPSPSFFSPFAHGYESDDAVDLAMMLEDEQFATFNSGLQEADLLETLVQEELLTVLAPTEEAFAALTPAQKQKISDPENLKRVLQYHLIAGEIGEEDIKQREVATLLEQNSVKIAGVPAANDRITVKLNDATASEPLPAINGVIIPIDKVLMPQDL